MCLVDKNGLNEKEFLASYNPGKYPQPSVTADVIVFAKDVDKLRLLLIKRSGHPFIGQWALPGGFVNLNESVEKAASRELEEETGMTDLCLELVGVFSKPGRDPRGWIISCAYLTVVASLTDNKAGDDAEDARWFDVNLESNSDAIHLELKNGSIRLTATLIKEVSGSDLTVVRSDGIAFDHAEMIARALSEVNGER